MSTTQSFAALIGLLAAAACTGDAEAGGGPESSVRDSAGVRIVQYGDVSTVVAPFRIGPLPVYRVGWDAGGREWASVGGW